MKANKLIQIVLLMTGVVLLVQCCKPEESCSDPSNPECENYDPCYGKIPTTAEFTIAQQYFGAGENANIYIEDDTVTGGEIKFTAVKQEGATYTWILGADTVVGNYEITRTLGDLPEGVYGNSLIVTKQTDTLCFPDDLGTSQFYRSFIRINGCDMIIFGKYKGVFSNAPMDSVEIELIASSAYNDVEPCEIESNEGAIFSVNLNLNGDTIRLNRNGLVNSRISFTSLNEIGKPEGEIIYNRSINEVKAIYSIDDEEFHFVGRKL